MVGPLLRRRLPLQSDDGPDVRAGSGDILLVHATETDRKGTLVKSVCVDVCYKSSLCVWMCVTGPVCVWMCVNGPVCVCYWSSGCVTGTVCVWMCYWSSGCVCGRGLLVQSVCVFRCVLLDKLMCVTGPVSVWGCVTGPVCEELCYWSSGCVDVCNCSSGCVLLVLLMCVDVCYWSSGCVLLVL